MSFERHRELMELAHLNIRTEQHGDEKVNGIDISFRVDLSNDVLSEFSPTLKSSLYQREETPQQDFDPATIPLKIVKNPQMGTIKWDTKYDCARVVVHHGSDEKNDVVFGLAKVNKFSFLPKNGGTLQCSFQVQVSDPDDMDLAKLAAVNGKKVLVTVESEGGEPEEDEQQADFGAAGNAGFAPPADGAPKADLGPEEEGDDEIYKVAMEHVIREQKVSVSIVQKLCKVGFNRAGRMVERMESQGVVSPEDGKGKRAVLIPADMLASQQAPASA
jgi:hypothetical protein